MWKNPPKLGSSILYVLLLFVINTPVFLFGNIINNCLFFLTQYRKYNFIPNAKSSLEVFGILLTK